MRILLDECVNPRVGQAFPGHEVLTVAEAKWRTPSAYRPIFPALVTAAERVHAGEVIHVTAPPI